MTYKSDPTLSGPPFLNVKDPAYGAKGDGTTDDRAALAAADSASFVGARFIPPGTYRVSANLTLASSVHFALGAILAPDAGVTVSLSGNITAPPSKIFGGLGTFSFVRGTQRHYEAAWWGFSTASAAATNAAALSAAYTALTSVGAVLFLPSGNFAVNTVNVKSYVRLVGAGCQTVDSGHGTILVGQSGQDVLSMPASSEVDYIEFSDFSIIGGNNGIVSPWLSTEVSMNRVAISTSNAAISIAGSVERWRLDTVRLSGGNYGFYFAYGLVNGFNYFDKCTFKDVTCQGHAINGWSIECLESSTVTWINPWLVNITQHGFHADGTIREWVITNYNTEGNGHNRTPAATYSTGSITNGSSVFTSASTAYQNGDVLTVAGAGANGADLTATVSSGGGTTALTLSVAASTSVTNAAVTNAIYDDFNLTNVHGTPANIVFVGGYTSMGGGGGTANLRYAINAVGANQVQLAGTISDSRIPFYDPTLSGVVVGGQMPVRRPAIIGSDNLQALVLSPFGGAITQVPSGYGQDWRATLIDSLGNQSGTFGAFKFILGDSNRTTLLSIDSTGNVNAHGYVQSQGNAKWYSGAGAPTISGNNGDLHSRTDGSTGTRLYVCAGGTTWIAIA